MSLEHRPRGTRRPYDPYEGITIVRGQGCFVWDEHGNRFVDFVAGYSTLPFGHAHPTLVAAAQSQVEQLAFCTAGQSPWRQQLEERLVQLIKRPNANGTAIPYKAWIATTGARAIELAWKIAYENRPGRILRFDRAFHGRSLATSLVSDSPRSPALLDLISFLKADQKSSVEQRSSLLATAKHDLIPYPVCSSRCDGHCPSCQQSLSIAESILARDSGAYSAMLVEPAIGARGYFFAPPAYYRQLVGLMRKHHVLVISDEIQMGLRRMGTMIASQADGWNADFVVLGKALGGGLYPISAVLGQANFMDQLAEGMESETFAATPLACRLALETLQLLDDASLAEHVLHAGEYFRTMLRQGLPSHVQVDGRGLATVLDCGSRAANSGFLARAWVTALQKAGVLVHLTGPDRNRIAIIPPLNVEFCLLESVAKEIVATIPPQFRPFEPSANA